MVTVLRFAMSMEDQSVFICVICGWSSLPHQSQPVGPDPSMPEGRPLMTVNNTHLFAEAEIGGGKHFDSAVS
jgi:hypothetical protein